MSIRVSYVVDISIVTHCYNPSSISFLYFWARLDINIILHRLFIERGERERRDVWNPFPCKLLALCERREVTVVLGVGGDTFCFRPSKEGSDSDSHLWSSNKNITAWLDRFWYCRVKFSTHFLGSDKCSKETFLTEFDRDERVVCFTFISDNYNVHGSQLYHDKPRLLQPDCFLKKMFSQTRWDARKLHIC